MEHTHIIKASACRTCHNDCVFGANFGICSPFEAAFDHSRLSLRESSVRKYLVAIIFGPRGTIPRMSGRNDLRFVLPILCTRYFRGAKGDNGQHFPRSSIELTPYLTPIRTRATFSAIENDRDCTLPKGK